jgi:sec-independent protein translocase protein TatA
MGSLSPWHLLILVAVLVLLFGAKKLPDAARSVQATATPATAGDDDKVAELQRQLDELKQQSPKNAG